MIVTHLLIHSQTQTQVDAIKKNQKTGAYLFHGPKSTGKASLAAQLAKALNCRCSGQEICPPCQQFQAGSYPDYITIQPQDKPSILISQIRSLIQSLSLSPYYQTGTRVVVIDDAELMTIDAQNALLKIIEEPPPQTLFILISSQPTALLATIRSRCAAVYFPPQPTQAIAELLMRHHGTPSAQANAIAATAAGAAGSAIAFARDPKQAQAQFELHRLIATIPASALFVRLQIVTQLLANDTNLSRFSQILQQELVQAVQSDTANTHKVAHQLSSLEQFRRYLAAKVAPRVALEQLMLEL